MRVAAICFAAVLTLAVAPSQAAAAPKPDLKVTQISTSTTALAAGSEMSAEDTTKNAGAAAAGRSRTRFYVSTNDTMGAADTRLMGKRAIGPIGRHKSSSGESALKVPLDAPQGDVFLIACADDRKQVKEKREGNNCRASQETISIELPVLCTDRLTALGISYEAGPSKQGVADPVTVDTPIAGVTYSPASSQNDDDALYMDCTLALALHAMAGEMSAGGLNHVEHFGIYNYRCIGGAIPNPGCPNGFSQHAYAKAIDIAELRSSAGDSYNVNDDWFIDPDATPTCTAATSSPEDELLHEFVCALFDAGTFNILLTQNYNADHRDHFHLDLTPEASFFE